MIGNDLKFWQHTGLFGGGHVTYGPGVLMAEGPFTNPARMIEDIMGGSTDRSEYVNGDCESDFMARVWAHAGWWDLESCQHGLATRPAEDGS